MANKKTKRKMSRRESEAQDKEIAKAMSEPWIAMRSGITMIVIMSLLFAAFMVWQLYPSEGWGRAIMWGLASGVAVWAIFLLGLGFNKLVRR
jgi:hypothetical protein